ncbi:MAG: T9SS type A sorting domain-containing protein [Ferruginibacter sp.]
MKKSLLFFFISLFCLQGFSQTTYLGTLANTDPIFNRPDPGTPPTTLSSGGDNVHYDVIALTITTPGMISFTSTSTVDNFGILYSPAGFDPLTPLNNALVANDDNGNNNFGFIYDFPTAGTYYLVVTSFKNGATGTYSVTLSPVVVVPVNIVSFTAEKAGASSNVVKWSNANEINVDKYQVQVSTDGKVFHDVLNAVITARNSSSVANYSYTIGAPLAGINFYRLKIMEKGGKTSLSPVAAVNNKGNLVASIKVFPNPAADYLFIETKSGQSGKANISVINEAGAIIYTKSYVLNNQPILTVDVRSLSTGKYFVKTIINKEEKIVAFIKK